MVQSGAMEHKPERNLGGERKRRATVLGSAERSCSCLDHQIVTRWLGGRKSLSPCLTLKAA